MPGPAIGRTLVAPLCIVVMLAFTLTACSEVPSDTAAAVPPDPAPAPSPDAGPDPDPAPLQVPPALSPFTEAEAAFQARRQLEQGCCALHPQRASTP